MKKILFWAAVTVIAAVSCDKFGDDALTLDPGADAFIASIEGADTKTVIEGMKSYWSGTEGIRVLDGSLKGGKVYRAEVEEKSQTAIFSPVEATTPNADDYLAVYPEGPAGNVEWSGNIDKVASVFWLPGDQNAVAGSYDPSTHIAVAYTKAGNNVLEFKNVNALVKVVIPYDNITEVCFYGNSDEIISGNFNVKYNNGDPSISTPSGTNITLNTYAKITAASGKKLEKDGIYYISILPTTFKKGFTVEFLMNGIKYIKKVNSEYKVSRNQIIDLPIVEYAELEEGKLYLEPNEQWKSDNARFAAYFFIGDDTNAECWVKMERVPNTYLYSCDIPKGYADVIICRMNPSTTVDNWDNKWTQTSNLNLSEGSVYTMTGWDTGKWSSTVPAVKTDATGMPSKYVFNNNGTKLRMRYTETANVYVVQNVTITKGKKIYAYQFASEVKTESTTYKGGILYLDSGKKMKLTSGGTDIFSNATTGNYDVYFDASTTKYLSIVTTGTDYSKATEQTKSSGKLFLTPNSNWKSDNARFAAYFMNSDKTTTLWVSMTKTGVGDIYQVDIPNGTWKYVIFCRMNPSATVNNWNNRWNQTADLEFGDNSLYAVKEGTWDNGGGTWSKK